MDPTTTTEAAVFLAMVIVGLKRDLPLSAYHCKPGTNIFFMIQRFSRIHDKGARHARGD